jgi:hypothetical protein
MNERTPHNTPWRIGEEMEKSPLEVTRVISTHNSPVRGIARKK